MNQKFLLVLMAVFAMSMGVFGFAQASEECNINGIVYVQDHQQLQRVNAEIGEISFAEGDFFATIKGCQDGLLQVQANGSELYWIAPDGGAPIMQRDASIGSTEAQATETPDVATGETNVWTYEVGPGNGNELLVNTWLPQLAELGVRPDLWVTPPNIPNVKGVGAPLFPVVVCENEIGLCVPNGMEWGQALSRFCQQDETCDWITEAQHTVFESGGFDISFDTHNMGTFSRTCEGGDGAGCVLVTVNSGGVTSEFDGQHFESGYMMSGRYFNGDVLQVSLWALISHIIANMTNQNTMAGPLDVLNSSDFTNAGSNCSTPEGCETVYVLVVFLSGNFVEGYAEVWYTVPFGAEQFPLGGIDVTQEPCDTATACG